MGVIRDLTGQKFGRLLVIREVETPEGKDGKKRWWLCKCDCGNYKIASAYTLINKKGTKSCGCLIKERGFSRCYLRLAGKQFW